MDGKISIAANGDATVVSGATTMPRTPLGFMSALAASSAPGEQPADIEGRAMVRKFLENYLTYTPTTLEKNWADALNMMTANLRHQAVLQMQKNDAVGKLQDEQARSESKLSSVEAFSAALYILGFKEEAEKTLSKFSWGEQFIKLNQEPLDRYSSAETSEEVVRIQLEYCQ
ncbi:MAG: DUF367 domain-containing protein [Thermodesulfobacteriota bacterium]